jgi:hypothetical protein
MYTDFLSISRIYSFVWQKYRPAILKLMVDSNDSPQQYQFSKHEIKSINPKERGGYSFTLRLHKGRSVGDIRKSAIAKDLLLVLQHSKKASELADAATYEFTLDKHFVLHVVKESDILVVKDSDVLQLRCSSSILFWRSDVLYANPADRFPDEPFVPLQLKFSMIQMSLS